MSTQPASFRTALVAICLCLLGLSSRATADYVLAYCSDINTSSNNQNSSIWQSLGLCHDFCVDSYAFAVVQYQECWCSNYTPGGDNSSCTTPCPGFPSETCGDKPKDLFGYVALNLQPSGTLNSGSAPSSTSSQSSNTKSPNKSPTSSSSSTWTPTPVVSIFTTTGQVETVTVTPTAPSNSQSGLGIKKGSTGLGTGGAVGLTIGLVALIAIGCAAIWLFFRRKHRLEVLDYSSGSRRGSSAGFAGALPVRTMSQHSRYVLGTDGRQVVEAWEPGDTPTSTKSGGLMPVDPRLDPFAPLYQRGETKVGRVSTPFTTTGTTRDV